MASPNIFYERSPEADRDLEDIFDYTESHVGLNQARGYVSALTTFLSTFAALPM